MTVLAVVCSLCLSLGGRPEFVESRIDVGSDFDYELAKLDADERVDVLVSRVDEGRMRNALLHVYFQREDGAFGAEPDWRMTVPPDVVCFAFLDVRSDPGCEILLMTRSGVFSVSTQKASLKDNLRREIAMPLFPNLAPSGELSRWNMVGDVDHDGRDDIILASGTDLVVLGAKTDAEGKESLVEKGRVEGFEPLGRDRTRVSVQGEGGELMLTAPPSRFFRGVRSTQPAFPMTSFFADSKRLRIPGLLDWTGDDALDAVLRRELNLRISPYDAVKDEFGPAITVPISDPSEVDDREDRSFELRDIDKDGDLDLVMTEQESKGLSPDHVVVVVPGEGKGKLAEAPSARIKFSALAVKHQWVDLDSDSLLDLFTMAMRVPIGITTLASVRLEVSLLAHMGEGEGKLSRKPALRFDRSFRPEELKRIQETVQFDVTGRFSGSALNDLILIQPDGVVEIHALSKTSDGLKVSDEAWSQFRARAIVRSLKTEDLSADGVSDLCLIHQQGLTLFVSRGSRKAKEGNE